MTIILPKTVNGWTAWIFLTSFLMFQQEPAWAQTFRFPTANRALLESGAEDKYFTGTVGRKWPSGTYGCVRSEGWQFHEGFDISSVERDSRNEPLDPILATADGEVVYINFKGGNSNYGIYIVMRHWIQGMEIYSLYAHLSKVRQGLRVGHQVAAGESIGVMGRTTNTRERISKQRAHLHFELCLLVNDRFAAWHKKHKSGYRNDHGNWNGQALIGMDPWALLERPNGAVGPFSLVAHVRNQDELCRVVVRDTDFPFLKKYPLLVWRNPVAAREGVAGYEIRLSFAGLPIALIPRAESELTESGRVYLLSVNEEVRDGFPCRKLVSKTGNGWILTNRGKDLISLLTY